MLDLKKCDECWSPSVILVRLKQDDVQLGEELEGEGDIGRERQANAGGNNLEKMSWKLS